MYKENIIVFRVLLLMRAIVKIIIDIYMFKQFISLFFCLIKRKLDIIEEKSSEEIPCRFKFIVVWVLILTVLMGFISLNGIFTYGIYHYYADPSEVPHVI
jgi:hypothetical protein